MAGISSGRVIVVGVALVAAFLIGAWRASPSIHVGRADAKADGGGTIFSADWAYAFDADVAWTDDANAVHVGGPPDCLPPMTSVEGVKFAAVEVTIEDVTLRPVVWIDCRSVVRP